MDIFHLWTTPDNPPSKTDCLIVLSYCVENTQIPTRPTRAIIQLAYQWWKKFPSSTVIMSTGDNQGLGIPNSTVMVRYAERIGIPHDHLVEEDTSWNTYENLMYSKKIADRLGKTHITLVTYDLHTVRAIRIADKLGWSAYNWVSVGGSGSPAYGIKSLQTYSRMTIFLYEVIARLYNHIRHQI